MTWSRQLSKQKRITHNKLVRDNIPQIIEADGHTCSIRTLSDVEYVDALKAKLVEESEEVKNAAGAAELTTELADLLEVMICICDAIDLSPSDRASGKGSSPSKPGRQGDVSGAQKSILNDAHRRFHSRSTRRGS